MLRVGLTGVSDHDRRGIGTNRVAKQLRYPRGCLVDGPLVERDHVEDAVARVEQQHTQLLLFERPHLGGEQFVDILRPADDWSHVGFRCVPVRRTEFLEQAELGTDEATQQHRVVAAEWRRGGAHVRSRGGRRARLAFCR